MSTCNDVRALLPLVVGGDLEEDQALVVTEHLEAGCEPCAGALRELQGLRGHLLELPERSPAPAVDLWPGVRAALVADGLFRTGPIVVRRARFGARGALLSAAAATLLVAGSLWSLQRETELGQGTPGTPVLAESEPEPVAPDLAPTLVGGPIGGLRPLEPDEEPFSQDAVLFGSGGGPSPLRSQGARPTLAGDHGGH